MSWNEVYDELTLLEKGEAGLPNHSYQLGHFQQCLFEKIWDGAMICASTSKSDEFDSLVNKLYGLQNDLEDLIDELTEE